MYVRSWKQPMGRGDPDRRNSDNNNDANSDNNIHANSDNNIHANSDNNNHANSDNNIHANSDNNIHANSDNNIHANSASIIRDAIQNMCAQNPVRKSYSPLLKHNKWPGLFFGPIFSNLWN